MEAPPPSYVPTTPPAGLRVPCSTDAPFPSKEDLAEPCVVDLDGSPVYLASALVGSDAVHPAKVVKRGDAVECMVSWGGAEVRHVGRYDILPITREMEWVAARDGVIPKGRRPVEGGFENHGAHLYHALVPVGELQVPGKTGAHLRGANAPFGGAEKVVREGYQILCWR